MVEYDETGLHTCQKRKTTDTRNQYWTTFQKEKENELDPGETGRICEDRTCTKPLGDGDEQ